MNDDRAPAPAPRPVDSGLKGACPRCGARTLFRSWIGFAEACPACGLRFTDFNVGDGPAAFLTLGIGTVVTILAISLELKVGPPWWVHVLIWPPLTSAGVVYALRIAKGWLLALEYRNAAREGKIGR